MQEAGHVVLAAMVRGLNLILSAARMHRRAINKGVTVIYALKATAHPPTPPASSLPLLLPLLEARRTSSPYPPQTQSHFQKGFS